MRPEQTTYPLWCRSENTITHTLRPHVIRTTRQPHAAVAAAVALGVCPVRRWIRNSAIPSHEPHAAARGRVSLCARAPGSHESHFLRGVRLARVARVERRREVITRIVVANAQFRTHKHCDTHYPLYSAGSIDLIRSDLKVSRHRPPIQYTRNCF